MKITFIGLLAFFLGCQTNNKENFIYGSWTTIEEGKYTNDNVYDSVVFSKPDSLRIYLITKEQITDTIFAKFELNLGDNFLLMKYDTATYRSRIVEFTRNRLITTNYDKGYALKLKRIE